MRGLPDIVLLLHGICCASPHLETNTIRWVKSGGVIWASRDGVEWMHVLLFLLLASCDGCFHQRRQQCIKTCGPPCCCLQLCSPLACDPPCSCGGVASFICLSSASLYPPCFAVANPASSLWLRCAVEQAMKMGAALAEAQAWSAAFLR